MILAEVAPAAPAAEGLAALFLLLAFVVCIGLQKAWRATVGWVFNTLADKLDAVKLPGFLGGGHIFGSVSSFLRSTSSGVEHALAAAALKSEAGAVWLFGQAAHQLAWMAREIADLSASTLHAVARFAGVTPRAVAGVTRAMVHAAIVTALHPIRTVEHALQRTDAQLWRSVHKIEAALPGLVPRGLTGLIPRVGTLERDWTQIKSRVSNLEKLLTTAGLAALIGATIFKLLPSFFRCPSFARAGNRIGCGGFQLLDDLLAGVIDVLIIADLCQITRLMIDAAESSLVQDGLRGLIGGIDDLLLCQGTSRPASWAVRAAALPPAQAYAALPAGA